SQDDRRHRQGEQSDFARVSKNIARIIIRAEIASDRAEENPFSNEHDQQDCFVPEQTIFPRGFGSVHAWSKVFRLRNPSATTASKMITPWIAFSQYASTWRCVSAGLMHTSSSNPANTPHKFPRPPEIATPPTTTAAMTLSSM